MNDKIHITIENGDSVEATAPIIISASRSTDIPAFYAKWFSTAWHKSNDGNTFHLTNKYLHKMATLHNYKCHKCGFSILSSKDGDNSVL